jgi:N-acetylglucosaminyl-diphospho-decaprenol L-rhamnosyltransferase
MNSASSDLLSILIVSYNTAGHLRRCLESLRAHSPSMAIEVIVIDNASHDGSADMVEQEFPECRLIRSEANEGYGVAINCGMRVARGNYLLFLNPDTETTAGALETLLNFAKSHPRAGVVTARLLMSDGSPQASVRRDPSATSVLLETTRLHLLLPRSLRGRLMLSVYYPLTKSIQVPWCSGACHLIPRAVWDDVGLLTEETFCGFDDFDYCYRVRRSGYEVWLCADAEMTHHCSVSVKETWSSWDLEQVSIHNSYVILSSLWPAWRWKALGLAEIASYLSEYLRHVVRRRAEYHDLGEDYRERLRRRIRLTWNFVLGREKPLRRFKPQRANRASEPLSQVADPACRVEAVHTVSART